MRQIVTATAAGALGFTSACLGVSVLFGFSKLELSLITLILCGVGAVVMLLALGLARAFGARPRQLGSLSLSALVISAALFWGFCVLMHADTSDMLAWAAVAFYGFFAGLSGGLAARLVMRSNLPPLDLGRLAIAVLVVAGLALFGWLHPVQMPIGAHVVHVTSEAEFKQEVEESTIPVVVEFGAKWCGPCRQIAPNLDRIAAELAGKVKFVSIDVDRSREIRKRFDFDGIPALLVFKNGKELKEQRVLGYQTTEQLRGLYGNLK